MKLEAEIGARLETSRWVPVSVEVASLEPLVLLLDNEVNISLDPNDIATATTAVVPVNGKDIVVQGEVRKEGILFRISEVKDWVELVLKTGDNKVVFEKEWAFLFQKAKDNKILFRIYDLLLDQPLEYFAVSSDDKEVGQGSLINIVGNLYVVQGNGEANTGFPLRIARVMFSPEDLTKACDACRASR